MIKSSFEAFLSQLINSDTTIGQAMNYSLLAGGKRLRPLLLLNTLKDFNVDIESGFHCGAALEMIHTYSLIHDDLPAMDNDDYRRGRLTNHKVYGEAAAILAGDGLLTKAFEIICASNLDSDINVKLVSALAKAAGEKGMIQGQMLDIYYEDKQATVDNLIEIDNRKTGELLTVPFVMAAIIARKEEYIELFLKIGMQLGLAFQIQDDILDVTKSSEEIGKSTSDIQNNKSTYVSLLGLQEAQNKVNDLYYSIQEELPENFINVRSLIGQMSGRSF